MKRRAIRCARRIRARRSIGASDVEDVEGLLSRGGDKADAAVLSSETGRWSMALLDVSSGLGRWGGGASHRLANMIIIKS
jgi:hypothetical protein